jgi:competence protein ComEC
VAHFACFAWVRPMNSRFLLGAVLLLSLGLGSPTATRAAPAARSGDRLQIYFVDVEGGQATLFVPPRGQSLLVDTGWPGNGGRDAERIVAAARKAGISKIDYVLLTHFHLDHAGGLPQLAARFPLGAIIDHGENRESTDGPTVQSWQAYQQLLASGKYKRLTVKPGEVLPVEGFRATVVSADGVTLGTALPGGGRDNPSCQNAEQYPADQTENARSLGIFIDFGKLRILDLGDLTKDKEMQLVCPQNKLGRVDIYIVSHHGWQQSGSPPFVDGIAPRVAVMDNGAKKGGTPSAWDIIEHAPGLEDLWQLHFSEEGGAAHNVAADFIANPEGPDAGNYLELTAWPDGNFEVFNSRTQKTKHYSPAAASPPKHPAHDSSG